MRIGISFTSCLRGVHEKTLDPKKVDKFIFGCREQHVLCDTGMVPQEVSWLDPKPVRSKDTEIGASEVSKEAFQSFARLLMEIKRCGHAGNVTWKAEVNYHEEAEKLLHEGHEIYLGGEWMTPAHNRYFGADVNDDPTLNHLRAGL